MRTRFRCLPPKPFILLCIALLLLGGAWAAFAIVIRSEDGTAEQQAKVRTSRDVSGLPLKTSCSVKPEKELFITNVLVVDDCYRTTWTGVCPPPSPPATRGAWTFGRLAEGIFGTTDPAVLSNSVLAWLNHWNSDQTVNGDLAPARPSIQNLVIDPWLKASGGLRLDMKKAPFRLLAIVARLDLRQNAGYSAGSTAGEGRFVFGVLDASGQPTEFLVILEYGLDADDCTDIKEWAEAWHSLGWIPFGPDYNAALQQITDRFATIGASPGKPNGSAINQVRTNEIFLQRPWELREFRLRANSISAVAPLVQVTVAQTPANRHQHQPVLADYVNLNEADILANNYIVPLSFGGQPFRGGASQNPFNNFDWDGPQPPCTSISNPDARHVFSLNTCNGCHGGETDTTFRHVLPRQTGLASQLSAFLTGGTTTDMCGQGRKFGDIDRRRVDLCQLLEKSCSAIDSEPAVAFVH